MKKCKDCKGVFLESLFHKDSERLDGLRPCCKGCDTIRCRKFRMSHKRHMRAYRRKYYIKNKAKIVAYSRASRKRNLAKRLIRGILLRAKQKGFRYDLSQHQADLEKRINAMRCEMTGIPLIVGKKRREWNSPSIHRVDPKMGYEYSNVKVVCWAINTAIGDWGEDVLKTVVMAWLERMA